MQQQDMYLAFACECEEVARSETKELVLPAKPLRACRHTQELWDCDCVQYSLVGAHGNCRNFCCLVHKAHWFSINLLACFSLVFKVNKKWVFPASNIERIVNYKWDCCCSTAKFLPHQKLCWVLVPRKKY